MSSSAINIPAPIPLEKCLAAYKEVGDRFGFSPVIQPGTMQLLGWNLDYISGPALANFIDQILVRRLNDFFPDDDHPLILDCGANIGFTVLNYKRQYPKARIIAFEPDPLFAPVLRRNLQHNGVEDVQVVEAAVWTSNEKVKWFSEGIDGSHIVGDEQQNAISQVQAIDLADYLNETVDLLKIDIEGAEYDVVDHLGKELRNVKNILVECHLGQTNIDRFGKMLQILKEAGFKLGINSFGVWRDLIRQTPVQPNHWEQYILLAGWRVSNPLVSQEETFRPYGGARLERELHDARDRLQDSLLALGASRARERQWLQPIVKEFVTHKHTIKSQSISGPFVPDSGKCWMVPLPNLKNEADNEENPARSALLLFEDENMLEPAHSLHEEIRASGDGRYSHWKDFLYFSTSDGSDPNTNRRRYSILYVTRRK